MSTVSEPKTRPTGRDLRSSEFGFESKGVVNGSSASFKRGNNHSGLISLLSHPQSIELKSPAELTDLTDSITDYIRNIDLKRFNSNASANGDPSTHPQYQMFVRIFRPLLRFFQGVGEDVTRLLKPSVQLTLPLIDGLNRLQQLAIETRNFINGPLAEVLDVRVAGFVSEVVEPILGVNRIQDLDILLWELSLRLNNLTDLMPEPTDGTVRRGKYDPAKLIGGNQEIAAHCNRMEEVITDIINNQEFESRLRSDDSELYKPALFAIDCMVDYVRYMLQGLTIITKFGNVQAVRTPEWLAVDEAKIASELEIEKQDVDNLSSHVQKEKQFLINFNNFVVNKLINHPQIRSKAVAKQVVRRLKSFGYHDVAMHRDITLGTKGKEKDVCSLFFPSYFAWIKLEIEDTLLQDALALGYIVHRKIGNRPKQGWITMNSFSLDNRSMTVEQILDNIDRLHDGITPGVAEVMPVRSGVKRRNYGLLKKLFREISHESEDPQILISGETQAKIKRIGRVIDKDLSLGCYIKTDPVWNGLETEILERAEDRPRKRHKRAAAGFSNAYLRIGDKRRNYSSGTDLEKLSFS